MGSSGGDGGNGRRGGEGSEGIGGDGGSGGNAGGWVSEHEELIWPRKEVADPKLPTNSKFPVGRPQPSPVTLYCVRFAY